MAKIWKKTNFNNQFFISFLRESDHDLLFEQCTVTRTARVYACAYESLCVCFCSLFLRTAKEM